MRNLERSIWKERVHRETRVFESETRGSHCVGATNAGFVTREKNADAVVGSASR